MASGLSVLIWLVGCRSPSNELLILQPAYIIHKTGTWKVDIFGYPFSLMVSVLVGGGWVCGSCSESLYCPGSRYLLPPSPLQINLWGRGTCWTRTLNPIHYIPASSVGGWVDVRCGVECLHAGQVVMASTTGDAWSHDHLRFWPELEFFQNPLGGATASHCKSISVWCDSDRRCHSVLSA